MREWNELFVISNFVYISKLPLYCKYEEGRKVIKKLRPANSADTAPSPPASGELKSTNLAAVRGAIRCTRNKTESGKARRVAKTHVSPLYKHGLVCLAVYLAVLSKVQARQLIALQQGFLARAVAQTKGVTELLT